MKGVNGTNNNEIERVQNNLGNAQRYDFRGKPNDGELKLNVEKDKLRLIGNPYPSALNLQKFLTNNTAITGIAYFWDFQDTVSSHYLKDYEGGYGAYSPGANAYAPAVFKSYNGASNETGNSGENGINYARKFSPIAQGFMVIGASDGKITFKNSYRKFVKENPQTSEFRQAENPEIIRINFSFNKTYTRQLVLGFNENATKYEDHAMDARSFDVLTTDAAWLIGENAFLINILPFKKDRKIPLLFSSAKDTEVAITLAKKIMEVKEIYLFDREDETYYNLFKNPVEIKLPKGNFDKLFFLVFSKPDNNKEIPIPEKEEEIPPDIKLIYDKRPRYIKVLTSSRLKEIKIFSLSGSLIFQKKTYENKQYYYFYTGNLRDAIYIVKVKTAEAEVSKKLLLTK